MKLTVRNKLLGGFCVVLGLMLAMGLLTYVMFARARTVSSAVETSAALNAFFLEREIDHLNWMAELSDQIVLGRPFGGELEHKDCGLGKWYYSFPIHTVQDAEFTQLYQALETPHRRLHETGKRIKELANRGDMDTAKTIYARETLIYVAAVQDLLTQMRRFFSDQATADKANLLGQMNTATVSISIILTVGIVLGLLIAVFVARSITGPLRALERISQKMAQGDLTKTEFSVGAQDEIGELTNTFSRMNRSIADIVIKVLDSADKLAAASQDMSSFSQEMNSSTQEISNTITQMNKGASTQAVQIEDTAKIMETSAVSLNEMVASAQTANLTIANTSSRLENGLTVVKEATQKIEQLSDTVLETTKVVQRLGESSQTIGAITETITAIADQTNLLALNAAIEAARAGEAGRGFAVVAEEVRKLAEGSADAVRKIGSLIKSIQFETGNAVTAIQKSAEEAREGKEQISDIINILMEVNTMAGESSHLAQDIVVGGQKRVREIEHTIKAIRKIAAIAHESATAAQTITASTEEQTASMQQMSASAQELARLAKQLKELAGTFKV